MPAYSVVNGLKLIVGALSAANGYGLDGVLRRRERPERQPGRGDPGRTGRALDTLDAVKDLLMAENAYQLVQGNFDRVAAVSLAQKDARVPHSLRSARHAARRQFTFTNRVTLHFDDLDPSAAPRAIPGRRRR